MPKKRTRRYPIRTEDGALWSVLQVDGHDISRRPASSAERQRWRSVEAFPGNGLNSIPASP